MSQNGGIKFCKGCDIQLSWKQQELKMFVMSSGLQGLLWASILAMCSNKWALLEIFRFIFFWRNIVYVYIWYWTGGKSFQDLLPPSQCGQAQCLGRGEVGTLLRSHESVRQFEGRQRKNLSNYAIGTHIPVHWKQNIQNIQLPDSTKNCYKLEVCMIKLNFSAK